MSPPVPEDKARACLVVLHRACVYARQLGYEGEREGLPARRAQMLAEMMDAVHDIPQLLLRWPQCNESLLRSILGDFDRKWAEESMALLPAYEDAQRERFE